MDNVIEFDFSQAARLAIRRALQEHGIYECVRQLQAGNFTERQKWECMTLLKHMYRRMKNESSP